MLVSSVHPAGLAARLHVSSFIHPGDTLHVDAGLNTLVWRAGSGSDVVADFGHTARMALQLPDGLSLEAGPEGFLMLAPVPEPAGWALLVMGLCVVLLQAAGRTRRGLTRARRRIPMLVLAACGLSAWATAASAMVSARVSVGGIDDDGAVSYREASCLANVWAVMQPWLR